MLHAYSRHAPARQRCDQLSHHVAVDCFEKNDMKTPTPAIPGRWLVLALLVTTPWLGQAQNAPAAAAPAATPASPPAAPVKRSAAELEKLVAPIALYPDPLLATVLPASVYPLEIVQAARFVADTNNLAKLDEQPWDENVKAVARVPEAIKQLNEDISWTIELGDAFLAQDKDVMDAIQAMRSKAQKAGTLQTTPQQIVTVTNMIVEKTVEQQVVVVTNTVVQIAPASSSVVYVPIYNPYTVYYPPPAYYANPYPLLTFGAGMAMGAIIANNCNWYHGGCYHGSGNVNINVNNNYNRNNNFNQNNNNNINRNNQGGQQKWQPDQNRLNKSGSPSASTRSAEARGYGSGGAKPSTGSVGARPSTGTATARPSTGTAGTRPSTGTTTARPSTGTAGAGPTSNFTPSANRSTASSGANRPSSSPGVSQSRSSPSSSGSAFGGASSGASTRAASSRGSSSRSSGFSGGGGGSRGGGGGGGRR